MAPTTGGIMIKRHGFTVEDHYPIKSLYLFPNNIESCREKHPKLLSKENIQQADDIPFSDRKHFILVESDKTHCECEDDKDFIITWTFDCRRYTLTQTDAIMLDGASTPVRLGPISKFGSEVNRAAYVHDLLYSLFHNVKRRTADQIFLCFLEADGTPPISRSTMYAALRLAGKAAWKMDPKDHWNRDRATLDIKDL
jgi:hypothetical protein